jgi:hypothetical protein
MESSWKNVIFANLKHQKIENVRNLYVLGTSFFDLFRFVFDFSCGFWVYILKIILRRWGIENYTFSIIKQHPKLNMNFISIKKHEMDFTLNFVFSCNVPYFFSQEGTLNFLSRKVP